MGLLFFQKKNTNEKLFLLIIVLLIFLILAGWWVFVRQSFSPPLPPVSFPPPAKDVIPFESEKDFLNYLQKGQIRASGYSPLWGPTLELGDVLGRQKETIPSRFSQTNVQVANIDEPDILKNDSNYIYFSQKTPWPIIKEPMPWLEGGSIQKRVIPPPSSGKSRTKIIQAWPPKDLQVLSEIKNGGDLLLVDNILVIFSKNSIEGYEVKNPNQPQRRWKIDLEKNTQLITSRLYRQKIYLILQQGINRFTPCPIKPLSINDSPFKIECREIYRPKEILPVNATIITMILDPFEGRIEKQFSFVVDSFLGTIYVSPNAIYITYPKRKSGFKIYTDFLREKCQDILPGLVFEKIKKLKKYEIREQTKMLELQMVLEEYQQSLEPDQKLEFQDKIRKKAEDYFSLRKREIEKTEILKINLSDLNVLAKGEVPGRVLNQFSLDEYQGYLRIATTLGERLLFFYQTIGESENDVYILDQNLKIVGSLPGLGLSERIYSVRFIEDKAYIVTFRQIDPFFVIDLSNPKNPTLAGELKIPGYSSYLHPITKDKILGLGKEGAKIKLSLFDVENPFSPKELDKYILDEFFSEVLWNHRAFLLDKDYQIFFVPTTKGGYIFSYRDNKLGLIKKIEEMLTKRAVYINNYLYILSEKKIIVFDEESWQKVKEIKI